MENVIFEGAGAAVARINLETEPWSAVLDQIRASNPNVLEVSLIRLR
jgi:D-3-phosphoglycerate dehydrogenase